MAFNGFILAKLVQAKPAELFRNANERKLVESISEARSEMADLIGNYFSRLMSFHPQNDIWVEVSEKARFGLISEHGGVLAGEVTLFVSRSNQHDDVHCYVEPKRPLFEVAIIPRTLKLFVLRAIQKVL